MQVSSDVAADNPSVPVGGVPRLLPAQERFPVLIVQRHANLPEIHPGSGIPLLHLLLCTASALDRFVKKPEVLLGVRTHSAPLDAGQHQHVCLVLRFYWLKPIDPPLLSDKVSG